MQGGYSHILARYLRLHLAGPLGISTAGVHLDLGEKGNAVLFARLSNIVADGEGFEVAYEWRGANSIKPCLRHWNVLSRDSDLARRDDSGTFVDLACSDASKFRCYTHEELRENARTVVQAADRHRAGGMTKARLLQTKMAIGFNCTQHGLLSDDIVARYVDFASVVTIDWMHTFLQTGVLTDEVFLLVTSAAHLGVSCKALRAFLQEDWCFHHWQNKKGKDLHHVFDDRRNPTEKLKCSASELLGLYGLLRFFVETRIADDLSVRKERTSFLACCDVVDAILRAKRRGNARASADNLQRLMETFMRKHLEAYGRESLRPKHHWAFDIIDQLRRDDMVMDCFAVERLHLRAKRIANNIENTTRFEASTLTGMLIQQMQMLQDANACVDGLRGEFRTLDGYPGVRVTREAAYKGLLLRAGDLVCHGNSMGFVLACACEGEELVLIADLLQHYEKVSPHADKWRRGGEVDVFLMSAVALPLAWQDLGDCVLVVV